MDKRITTKTPIEAWTWTTKFWRYTDTKYMEGGICRPMSIKTLEHEDSAIPRYKNRRSLD